MSGLISSALDIDVSVLYPSNSNVLYICPKVCYKRYKKCKISLQTTKTEIVEEFKKNERTIRTKWLRKADNKANDNTTSGVFHHESNKQSRVVKALELYFPTTQSLTPLSATCTSYNNAALPAVSCQNTMLFDNALRQLIPALTSTPKKSKKSKENIGSVKMIVEYPSKTVRKTLSPDYEAIGKALTFGSAETLAKAVTKNKFLTKHVVANVLQIVSREVSSLCSRSKRSLLRKCDKNLIFLIGSTSEDFEIIVIVYVIGSKPLVNLYEHSKVIIWKWEHVSSKLLESTN